MFATSGYFVLSSPAWHLASPPFSTARREPHSRATSPPSRPTRKVCTTSATSSSGGGKEADDALHSAAREKVDLSQEIIQIIVSSGRVVSLARSRLRKRALPSVPVSFGILGVHPNQRYCCVNSLKLLVQRM